MPSPRNCMGAGEDKTAKRIVNTVRFYELIGQLEDALGGTRTSAAALSATTLGAPVGPVAGN